MGSAPFSLVVVLALAGPAPVRLEPRADPVVGVGALHLEAERDGLNLRIRDAERGPLPESAKQVHLAVVVLHFP